MKFRLKINFFAAAMILAPGLGHASDPWGVAAWSRPPASGTALSQWLGVERGIAAGSQEKDPAAGVHEQALQMELAALGIANLRSWRREGAIYRAEAEWYGEQVDLHVDAQTGAIKQPERLKGSQIEQMLRQQGWEAVKDVKRGGDTFMVLAERDRRVHELKIDARTGHILEMR